MNFLVLGADQLGHAVVYDLVRSMHVDQILLADNNPQKITCIMERFVDEKIVPCQVDLKNTEQVLNLMGNCNVAISTLPSSVNYELAKMALQAGCNFCDMGSDDESSRMQFLLNDLAKQAGIAIVPGCGLTPGMVSILTTNAIESLEQVYSIHIQVGSVPAEQEMQTVVLPALSAERILNEALENATIVRNGKLMRVPPLTEVETIALPLPFGELEAFNASGGMAKYITNLASKVDQFDFKVLHYPGYSQQMLLLRDLGLFDSHPITLADATLAPQEMLNYLLDKNGSRSEPDAVLVRINVVGTREKKEVRILWDCIDYMDQAEGLPASVRMKAFPTSVIAQMIARQDITEKGALTQESAVNVKLYLAELASRGIGLSMTEEDLSPAGQKVKDK
jgi:saccharopine dehydrogenase-like NADP-dependent oxidoreductase